MEQQQPGGGSEQSGAGDLFAEAYRAYLRAVKQAWADVDVDELAQDLANNNVLQGCGEGFSSMGTAGTAASVGTAGGTFGTIGTVGTFGCAVKEADQADEGYDGVEAS